jgi:hypothetical protein
LRLLQITYRQWTFRNGTVHLRGPDGLTQAQQDRLARRCEELLWTDPSTLLDEDKYLLDIDFEKLGDGPSAARQAWISEMEAARAAACYASREELEGDLDDLYCSILVQVDTEGSIRFCRRRRRRRRSGIIGHSVCSISRIGRGTTPYGSGCCSELAEKKGCCPVLFTCLLDSSRFTRKHVNMVGLCLGQILLLSEELVKLVQHARLEQSYPKKFYLHPHLYGSFANYSSSPGGRLPTLALH